MILHPPRGTQNPIVTFWGAAQSVTGSMHLVEVSGERILLDCGSVRGERGPSRARAATFPFDPATINAVVLSHAHTDHCGNLPNLVRQGFDGPIYCTPATRDLIALMLGDSARIQEEDARVHSIVSGDSADGLPSTSAGQLVEQTLRQCVAVPYGESVPVTPHAELRLLDAGHILGSAMVALKLAGPRGDVTLTFTGDLGRRGLPFLHAADAVPAADLLLCESTYGGRLHQSIDAMADTLARVIERSADEGGVVLIPAFSLGRTQLVVHYLQRWVNSGRLPRLPIFVDSPLAADIADVHACYPESFPEPLSGTEQRGSPVHYVRSPQESDELAEQPGPCVIVASGGMCDGGRIVKHLRRHIDDPRASLVLVSYQAPDSLGRKLLERKPKVRFHGRNWNKWIDVVEVNGFSGHADRDDFLAYLGPLAERTGKVRLVHGEPEQAWALADRLCEAGFADVDVPAREEVVCID
jgi:metallo-beta-lactamase family protein